MLGLFEMGLCLMRNSSVAANPSLCGILVYRELTSKVTKRAFSKILNNIEEVGIVFHIGFNGRYERS